MSDPPIACTLPTAEVPGRLALIERLRPVVRETIPGGARLRFAAASEARVRALVTLEERCCPFLRFAVARAGDLVVLDVIGPPDAQPLIERFFAG